MRVIAKSTPVSFWAKHPETKSSLERWLALVEACAWTSTNDIVATFANAVVLNGERVRFEVDGGNYRMIVSVAFRPKIVFIKFLGTHKEYDAVDALTVANF